MRCAHDSDNTNLFAKKFNFVSVLVSKLIAFLSEDEVKKKSRSLKLHENSQLVMNRILFIFSYSLLIRYGNYFPFRITVTNFEILANMSTATYHWKLFATLNRIYCNRNFRKFKKFLKTSRIFKKYFLKCCK